MRSVRGQENDADGHVFDFSGKLGDAAHAVKRARSEMVCSPIYGEDEIPEVSEAGSVSFGKDAGDVGKKTRAGKPKAKTAGLKLGEDEGSVAGMSVGGTASGDAETNQKLSVREVAEMRRGGLANRQCHCCDAQLGNNVEFKDDRRAQMNRMYVDLRDKMPLKKLAEQIAKFFNENVRRFTILNGGSLPEWTGAMVEDHMRNCLQDPIIMAIQDVRDWDAISKQCGDAIFETNDEGVVKHNHKAIVDKQIADKMKYGILRHTRVATQ